MAHLKFPRTDFWAVGSPSTEGLPPTPHSPPNQMLTAHQAVAGRRGGNEGQLGNWQSLVSKIFGRGDSQR